MLAGGVGAARFLDGLCRVVDAADVTVICNVSDDFEWHGLHVSPDIDTLIYTLAGLEGELGWGLRDDSAGALGELEALGEEPVFRVGHRDPPPHIWRTERLRAGRALSAVTAELARARGLGCLVLPVTDEPHPTVVETPEGDLAFQDYFVRGRAAATVNGLRFPGAAEARPQAGPRRARGLATRGTSDDVNPARGYSTLKSMLRVSSCFETLSVSMTSSR